METEIKINNRIYPVTYQRENGKVRVSVQGRRYLVDAVWANSGRLSLLIGKDSYDALVDADKNSYTVNICGKSFGLDFYDIRERRASSDLKRSALEGRQSIHAPMAGQIVRVLVKVGDLVEDGEGVVIMEAMKMENELKSLGVGRVKKIAVHDGDIVEPGQELLIIE